ncbi:hypothetical protein D3C84_1003490 [compost metagenome]
MLLRSQFESGLRHACLGGLELIPAFGSEKWLAEVGADNRAAAVTRGEGGAVLQACFF